jgi:hypothetical protein
LPATQHFPTVEKVHFSRKLPLPVGPECLTVAPQIVVKDLNLSAQNQVEAGLPISASVNKLSRLDNGLASVRAKALDHLWWQPRKGLRFPMKGIRRINFDLRRLNGLDHG